MTMELHGAYGREDGCRGVTVYWQRIIDMADGQADEKHVSASLGAARAPSIALSLKSLSLLPGPPHAIHFFHVCEQ
jgi:hypothetical protein